MSLRKWQSALLTTHAGQVTETRQVCILFFDIRDFTRFSEGKTPSEVVRFLNTLFGPLVEIVDAHGGIINKFLGDGFLAIFGAPITDDKHCLSATKAALALVSKVAALGDSGVIPRPALASVCTPAPWSQEVSVRTHGANTQ